MNQPPEMLLKNHQFDSESAEAAWQNVIGKSKIFQENFQEKF